MSEQNLAKVIQFPAQRSGSAESQSPGVAYDATPIVGNDHGLDPERRADVSVTLVLAQRLIELHRRDTGYHRRGIDEVGLDELDGSDAYRSAGEMVPSPNF